jgi:hypothetical protein
MDLRLIVLYLKMKCMKSRAIYDDLVITLHDEASEYSTVTLRLHQERPARLSAPNHNLTENRQVSETDQALLSTLIAQPFASIRDIAPLTCLSRFTVHCPLSIGHCPLAMVQS